VETCCAPPMADPTAASAPASTNVRIRFMNCLHLIC
jgi:hypothetical protein